MIEDKHKFTTCEEQISILRERGLIIPAADELTIKETLIQYSYYNIINGS
jgi:hypothetical protein